MKTFKDLPTFENKLQKGICWGNWIKVAGRVYKMVEYGDGMHDNYMLFQNKPTRHMIEIRYQVPCTRYDKQTESSVEYKHYAFHSMSDYPCDALYRY